MMIGGDIPDGSVWTNNTFTNVYAFVQGVTDVGMVTYSLLDVVLGEWDRYNRRHADEFLRNYTLMQRVSTSILPKGF